MKILMMGEEISHDDLPPVSQPVDNVDYFKRVRISPRAIDEASRIIPQEHYRAVGLYSFLAERANHIFKHLPASQTSGRFRTLEYFFEYDAEGPIVRRIAVYHG